MFEQIISDIISGKITIQQTLLSVASNPKPSLRKFKEIER
jgi:hypothetical protein